MPAEGTPLRIGAIFPQDVILIAGSSAAYRGAEAMRRTLNDCGGIGGQPLEFEYVPAADRDAAEAAVQILAEANVPLIIGSGLPAVSEGASASAQSAGIVYWEMTDALLQAGDGLFAAAQTDVVMGRAAAQFAQTALVDVLDGEPPRIALIYEGRLRGQETARGVRAALEVPPVIDYSYDDYLRNPYAVAEQIRDQQINIVILSVFDDDGRALWYGLREANANIKAWLHIGSQGYRRVLCQNGSTDAFMGMERSGYVNVLYADEQAYTAYRRSYTRAFSSAPDFAADVSAAGVYVLGQILGQIEGHTFTPVTIRAAIEHYQATVEHGVPLVRQQQGSHYCVVYPGAIASCGGPVIPFPTWRERAVRENQTLTCGTET